MADNAEAYARGFNDGFEAGRKSKILMLSNGEYSDYRVLGSFDVMRSFTFRERIADFKFKKVSGDHTDADDFMGYLVQHGFIQACDTEEVHLGSYGDVEVSKEALDKPFHPWAVERLTRKAT